VTAGGGRRRPEQGEPGAAPAEGAAPPADGETPPELIQEVDPDFERLLAEEEDIERRTREHHEAPHFHKDTE
jgi:small subunit ribosomal protein S3